MPIKRFYDVKRLVRCINKAPAIPDKLSHQKEGAANAEDLSEYVYQRLFLPIVQQERVPLEGLDFSQISEDELAMLEMVLDNCDIFPLVSLGLAFNSMPPASVGHAKFI